MKVLLDEFLLLDSMTNTIDGDGVRPVEYKGYDILPKGTPKNLNTIKKSLSFMLTALLLATLGFGYTARAEDDPNVKELTAIYAKLDAAFKAKDLELLTSYYAKDYTAEQKGKTLKREEAVASLGEALSIVKEISSATSTIVKVEQVEGNYIVDLTQVAKGTIAGPDGKDHVLEASGKSRDWWIKTDEGKWENIHSEDLSSTVLVDGKPVS